MKYFIHILAALTLYINVYSSLIPPQPFANPKNDDEYFFNFRLEHFAPSTEPLIKETFGNNVKFENEGFWEHNSYNSHAISFATNLPTISIIEYGTTTNYGQTTEQSNSYYYNHLHYIKNLSPNTTYHYRITVQDYEGNLINSDDYTFTTKALTDDIIRIPDDLSGDAPYTLTKSNAKYVLTKDLNVPTLAINIKANDIEIDLNGHTITYDNSTPKVVGKAWNDYAYNEEASFGIRAGLWNYKNAKVFNGIIKQGKNGGMGYIGIGFNPLFLNHMGTGSYNEVAGITVDYYGASVSGMIAGNGKIHHNVIIDRGTEVDNRHQGIKAMVIGDNAQNEIAYNSVRRFRHQGIMGSGYKHHNEVYSDSYATNSFLIAAGDSGRIEHNKMFGMGFNPVGTSWASNTIISNNFIYLHGTAPKQRSTEYDRISGIAGVRFTLYGGTTYTNSVYEDNTIIVKAWAGCPTARGIWTATGHENLGVYYRRNVVKAELLSYDDIQFNKVELAITAVDINGQSLPLDTILPTPAIFEDNTFIGNVSLITFGSSYGVGSNSHFYRTKLKKINNYDEHFKPVRMGYYPFNTYNNLMIDTEVGEGINIDPPIYHHLGKSAGYMEVTYGNLHNLLIMDKVKNSPVRNTDVSITIDDKRTLTVKTGNDGKINFDLLTVQHISNKSVVSRTEYEHYTFNVSDYKPYDIATTQLKNTDTIFLNDVNSIENNIYSDILLFPNITNDYFSIIGLYGNETIDISDITGRHILTYEATNEEANISISHLPQGIYFVRVISDKEGVALKMVMKM